MIALVIDIHFLLHAQQQSHHPAASLPGWQYKSQQAYAGVKLLPQIQCLMFQAAHFKSGQQNMQVTVESSTLQEHKLYPKAVAALAEGRITWREDGVPVLWSPH